MAASAVFAEDELGRKWDRCLTDVVLKTGGGILIGAVVTTIFFKRRSWPIFLGAGFGIGKAYRNCELDLNSTLSDSTSKQSKANK
ncbi:MICOS complex subunit Mic10-like [Zootermopsis nevadensis]|uniref:MICOS complex subunit Mic10-like n=1 Tax=Zootermopsis nevadensis TaxID=136037 RepID=UPI000B8EB844|nr:MICOS complex subunit Mic10-like [Zootermopsis nevadensis]XP_021921767.1 MICOS complex subunit Mic10-like [Zootermopsis nevadensis]